MKTAMKTERSLPSPSMSLARLLSETGMLAAGMGDQKSTETIFDGLRVLKPKSDLPIVGMALARMNGGDWDQAIALLSKAHLHEHRESEAVNCFLALALHCGGRRQESMRMIEMVRKEGKEPWAVAMANALAGVKEAEQ